MNSLTVPKHSTLIFNPKAHAKPIEDLVEGDEVHPTQRLEPAPQLVYDIAVKGLSNRGTAALAGMDSPTMLFHYPKTIALARATRAAELMERLNTKADDELSKGDLAAIKLLLNRLDPEEKEPGVVINQQINISERLQDTTVLDLNAILTGLENQSD